MGKARRIKAQRRRSRYPQLRKGGRPLNTIEDIEAAGEVFGTDMPGRVTYLTDPALGGGQPAAGIGPDGNPIPDTSGTTEPTPVVLFEPTQIMMIENTDTGMLREGKTEGIVANGFHRMPGGMVWIVKPAPGWEVRRLPGELILCDGTGEVWASSKVTPDPAWVSAAASYRDIIVFYGPKLGVRTPPGMNPASYTTAKRAAEFRQGRREGLVTAATVKWRGEATDETLEWVTFLPGSFCQPLPGMFAPITNFTRNGGPEAFGLSRLRDHGLSVSADPIKTLIARVSRTDIDLTDPAEAPAFDFIGGVHYNEGVSGDWRKAAFSQGRVLLLTGHSLPTGPGRDPDHSLEALGELWGAVISVQASR